MSDTASEFSEKEGEITLLTVAFEGMDLRANTIDVHKLEGGMHSTVRLLLTSGPPPTWIATALPPRVRRPRRSRR